MIIPEFGTLVAGTNFFLDAEFVENVTKISNPGIAKRAFSSSLHLILSAFGKYDVGK